MKFSFPKQTARWIAIEVMLAFVTLVAFAGLLVFWRLLSGPISADFAKPYIEKALADQETGLKVSMDKIVLYWPEVRGPLLLGFKNSRVYAGDGHLIASVDEAALGLSKSRLLIGQVSPIALILKKPSLRVIRLEDNSFDVGLAGGAPLYGPPAPDQVRQGADPVKQILQLLARPENAKDTPAALAYLRTLRIDEAVVVVDDHVADMTWTIPKLDLTIKREGRDLHSYGSLQFSDAKDHVPALKLDAHLDLKTELIRADAVLEYFEPKIVGQRIPELGFLKGVQGYLNAQMKIALDEKRDVQSAELTVLSETGAMNVPELSSKPIPFSDMGLYAKYDSETGKLELSRAQLKLNDKVEVAANAELDVKDATFEGPVRFEIEQIAQSEIGPLWPEALKDEAAYEWVVDKLSNGTFTNVYAQLDLKAFEGEGGALQTNLDNVVAGFSFSGMDVDYRAPLKPVTGASGQGTFDMKAETLSIDVKDAKVLDMDIPSGKVELSHIIEKGKGQAGIEINLSGPLKSLLTFVKDEPIGVNTGIDIANSEGQAEAKIVLSMPTHPHLKMEDVKIDVDGKLSNAKVPKVVKDLTLSGGPYTMGIHNGLFSIKGKGKIEDQDASIAYEEFLSAAGQKYTSKATVNVSATQALRDRMGIDLSTFMEGSAPINAVYTAYPDRSAKVDIKVDIGPSRIFAEPFDYVKEPGQPGSAVLTAILKNGFLSKIKDLTGSAPGLTLESSQLGFREGEEGTELASGQISRFTLGKTVAALKFDISQAGVLKIVMDGPFLDARPFLNKEEEKDKPYSAPPMQVSVSVDRMQTTDEDQVQYAKLFSSINAEGRFEQMELDGIAGKGDLYMRFKPDGSGMRTFRLEADDAGATLKAFGLYDNIIGGKLVIYGEPIQGVFDRNLKGRAEMTDFKVVKAPLLGKLLGLMSLNGVTQALSNEGLGFTKLESRFDWLYRPKGSLLVLKDGRTSGNAVGLTFDGTFDNAKQYIDVEGTVIPLSGVNKIIGNIPLVGDILTGGTGSLIAATYSMKGEGENVNTFVNPLSVLTPGILRRILFESDKPGADEKPQEPSPEPKSNN